MKRIAAEEPVFLDFNDFKGILSKENAEKMFREDDNLRIIFRWDEDEKNIVMTTKQLVYNPKKLEDKYKIVHTTIDWNEIFKDDQRYLPEKNKELILEKTNTKETQEFLNMIFYQYSRKNEICKKCKKDQIDSLNFIAKLKGKSFIK